MMKFKQLLVFAFTTGALALSSGKVFAQGQGGGGGGGRGNFDPAQFQQRMLDRYREDFEIKSDDEWKAIQPRVEKVMQVRRELIAFGGGFGGFGGRGGRPPGGGNADANANGGNAPRRNAFRGEPSPETEALQKAIDAKASSDEIKNTLAKFRDARKAKETELEKAQDDLRKVLTMKQEAAAVLAGLLK